MAKPTTIPRWADTVTADPTRVNAPPNVKLDVGWDVAEKPPAQWFNWLFLNIYLWIIWLRDFEGTVHNWGATQSFDYGIIATNATVNGRAGQFTGNGTGYGVFARGGANGVGVHAVAFGATTAGVEALGDITGGAGGPGLLATGGTGGAGGVLVGNGAGAGAVITGGTSGAGVIAQGNGTAEGVRGTGGVTNGIGVRGLGGTNGAGVTGQGNGTAEGVRGTGGATNGIGVLGQGTGTGAGVRAVADTGDAIDAVGKIVASGNIESAADVQAAGSLFAMRNASGTSLPTPTLSDGEHTLGDTLYCRYHWVADGFGGYDPVFDRGRGVIAITKIADGDVWINWQVLPASLAEARAMGAWANNRQDGADRTAQAVDADLGGAGGTIRTRVKTYAAGALSADSTATFLLPY